MINLPTIITISRMLIIIPFILVAPKHPYIGGVIFSIAALTDYFDGYIARKTKQVTKLGMLLDPVADKLLIISALIIFVDIDLIPIWIAFVIIAREFIVTGLRIVALSKDIVIPAEMGGKIKVIAQIAAIIFLFAGRAFPNIIFYSIGYHSIGIVLLWIAMILGILSGIQYFVLFWKRYD